MGVPYCFVVSINVNHVSLMPAGDLGLQGLSARMNTNAAKGYISAAEASKDR